MLSYTEENYLKALVQIGFQSVSSQGIGTNELAAYLNVKPATVNDMLKKLREKHLVSYEKYGKITLSEEGRRAGLIVIRKHRLWETFLVEKLNFSWDEVHEVAEQMEHIQSVKLVEKLDAHLGFPRFDPHGDAIPDANGDILIPFRILLSELPVGTTCKVAGVKDNSAEFLQYVDRLGAGIGSVINVLRIENYDGLTTIKTQQGESTVSHKFTSNVYVVCEKCNVGKDCNQQECSFRVQRII